ncbi:hypothetical protein A2W24_02170 [Microgenomates group bacterium RBG_16_45_19]|nr:MAG: hypothetical protein A2W24_02170 [Microgenomates group bacterium RBG_16_45_19]
MSQSTLNWKIVGAAGEGIKSTGMMFSKTLLRSGFYAFDYTEYPSLIRGGHNTYQVYASGQPVYSQVLPLDLFISLNPDGLKLHTEELTPTSVTLFDGVDLKLDPRDLKLPGQVFSVPLTQLARDGGGERVMANNVALGISLQLLHLDLTILNQVIADTFAGKNQAVVSLNQKAAALGYQYAAEHLSPLAINLIKAPQPPRHSLTGNEAIALGLIAGGLKAYLAYPMTPSSSILHSLADWQAKANLLVKHAEDEIGVINMALGMSYAGIRAAVGTSGGGFCYMTEALGLAGIAELPLVIIEAQRPGPALGMPTWTAQADLLFAINAAQDEFPRIVLAPGDVTEAFTLAKLSLTLAEEYQLPVILLSDKHLSESAMWATLPAGPFSHPQTSIDHQPQLSDQGFFPRYQPTPTGISLRTIPGIPHGQYLANSYEHDQHGLATETAAVRQVQMHKRQTKLNQILSHLPQQFYDGSEHPQLTLIGFGSTKTVLQAAAQTLKTKGHDVAVFNLSWLWPFPSDQVNQVFSQSQNTLIFEGNYTQQLARLIRQQTGLKPTHQVSKYDGRPFYPHEVVQAAEELLS